MIAAIAASGNDYVLDMGDYKWTIKSGSIASMQNVNLHVSLNAETAIPTALISELAGTNEYMKLALDGYSGAFGFEAEMTVNAGTTHTGMFGNLYYYNANGELEFVDSAQVDANGNLTISFTHASDYVIIFSDADMNPASVSPKTGDTAPIAGLLLTLFAGVVLFAAAYRRKKVRKRS